MDSGAWKTTVHDHRESDVIERLNIYLNSFTFDKILYVPHMFYWHQALLVS